MSHVRWSENLKDKPLSSKQIEILQLIADGVTSRGISIELNISRKAVSTQREFIYKKLDALSGPNAVAIGIRKGIIK